MKGKPTFSFDLQNASIDDITTKSLDVINRMEAGDIHFGMAKEISNALGKCINSIKVQVEYASLRKEKPTIPFIERAKVARGEAK